MTIQPSEENISRIAAAVGLLTELVSLLDKGDPIVSKTDRQILLDIKKRLSMAALRAEAAV